MDSIDGLTDEQRAALKVYEHFIWLLDLCDEFIKGRIKMSDFKKEVREVSRNCKVAQEDK